eukprot:4421097-Amphidinium_carterae.1
MGLHMTSIDKRCELALHCRLREQCCIQDLAPLLPGEPPISASTEIASWVFDDKQFLMPMKKARQHLLDALQESKEEDSEQHGEDIFATIRLHTKHLNHLDAF